MRTIYFDCYSGASGDMILGALVDAGASPEAIARAVDALSLSRGSVTAENVMKGAVRATQVSVATDPSAPPRNYRDIVALIEGAQLDERVRNRVAVAFRLLAEAEAKIHNVGVDDVHFHEVGSDDAIIDIVGGCAALEELSPDRVVVSAIATGRGSADSSHGPIPVPAPAVLEILKGATLYEHGTRELITPTGAALLASWADAFGVMSPMKIEAIGYGAGSADLEWPNVLRVIVGDSNAVLQSEIATELLETNIDDMSPELLPYVIEQVLSAGALDAWATSAHMKKGRIGTVLSVLVEKGASQPVLDLIFRETTTFGVRITPVEREVLDRKEIEVAVAGHRIRVKVGYRNGEPMSYSPEYEDAAAVARATGMPLKDVYRSALELSSDG